jgi:hypothetical protein
MAPLLKVALVFVPQGEPAMPHMALPMLKGYLQERLGVSADLVDLNLAFYRQLLSRDGVSSLTRLLEKRGGLAQDPALGAYLAVLAEEIPGALALLDGRAWDPDRYAWALDRVADACALFGRVHTAYALSLKNLSLPEWDASSQTLGRWVEDPENPFVAFFERYVERLAGYDLVGLGLAWTGQLVPLFTLARLLKRRSPGLRIVLGGSLVPHLLEGLLGARQLMRNIDLLVPFEGERPLAGIVAALGQGLDPSSVEGVLALATAAHGQGLHPRPAMPLAADAIPTPDYTGLPIEQYLSPRRCLPLLASRGCHYGRCAFCDHFHHVSAYRARPVSKVLEEMHSLRERHDVRHFFFVDDALPVATLRGLSQGLRAGPGEAIRFMAEMRLEPALTAPLLAQAAAAGCHALLFGLESGSQRTLDRMRKGIDLQVARRVLKEAHAVGILTWCFFMIGYPGERLDEIAATFRLLQEQRRDIDVIAGGAFVMCRHAPLANGSAMPGLAVDGDVADLSLTRAWRHPDSPTHEEVNRVLSEAEAALAEIFPCLASFVEAHLFAFAQEDYQQRLVCRPAPEA